MVKSQFKFILILLLLIFSLNCKKKTDDYFTVLDKNEFYWVIYTKPSRDCFDCIRKATKILDSGIDISIPITFFLIKSEDQENEDLFKTYIKDQFKTRNFIFIEKYKKLSFPHPSILLVKERGVYMYFFIYNDPFLFNDYFNKCRELFINSNNPI